MEGELTLDSAPGKGMTVVLRIPLGVRKKERAPRTTLMAGVRCLVVDDDAVSSSMIKELMKSFGIEAVAELKPERGLAAFKQADENNTPYHLLITDWRMPTFDGMELSRQIRSDPTIKTQPIIIMISAYSWDGIPSQAEKAGVDSFLHKPINESVLLDTIMNLLQPQGRVEDEAPMEADYDMSSLEGMQVLVVEDNSVNQQIAQEILTGMGLRVTLADNGEKALGYFEPPGVASPFALVFMDLQMPGMDGFEAAKALRALDTPSFWSADLPIIAMTAHSPLEETEKCAAAGFDDHVNKPIDVNELCRALCRWRPPVAVKEQQIASKIRVFYEELRVETMETASFQDIRAALEEHIHEGRLLRLEALLQSGKLQEAAAFLGRLNGVLQFMDES
jgi:CheY-like chemotaxis protein